jgi:hypothetical protein
VSSAESGLTWSACGSTSVCKCQSFIPNMMIHAQEFTLSIPVPQDESSH